MKATATLSVCAMCSLLMFMSIHHSIYITSTVCGDADGEMDVSDTVLVTLWIHTSFVAAAAAANQSAMKQSKVLYQFLIIVVFFNTCRHV